VRDTPSSLARYEYREWLRIFRRYHFLYLCSDMFEVDRFVDVLGAKLVKGLSQHSEADVILSFLMVHKRGGCQDQSLNRAPLNPVRRMPDLL